MIEDKREPASTAIDTWLKAVDNLKADLDSLLGKWSKDQDDSKSPEIKPGEKPEEEPESPKEKPDKKPEEKPIKSKKPEEDKKHIGDKRPSFFDLVKKIDKDKESPEDDEDILPNKLNGDKLPPSLI